MENSMHVVYCQMHATFPLVSFLGAEDSMIKCQYMTVCYVGAMNTKAVGWSYVRIKLQWCFIFAAAVRKDYDVHIYKIS